MGHLSVDFPRAGTRRHRLGRQPVLPGTIRLRFRRVARSGRRLAGWRATARRQHDHHADGEKPAALAWPRSAAQGDRGMAHAADRIVVAKAKGSGGLSEYRGIRSGYLWRRGRRAYIFPQTGYRVDHTRGGATGERVAAPSGLDRAAARTLRPPARRRHRAPHRANSSVAGRRRLISAARDPDPRIAPPAFTFTTDYDCVHK